MSWVVSVFCVFDQLSSKVVSLTEVRRLASQGIPDGAGIRSTVWKVVLYVFLFLFFFFMNYSFTFFSMSFSFLFVCV